MILRSALAAGMVLACAVSFLPPAGAQSPQVQIAFQHGATALREGRSADAEREFRTAVRLDPNLPEAHLDLGLVLGREGKNAAGIEELRKAIALNPKLDSAHLFTGVFLYQTGHNEQAIAELQQELALNPKSGEALSWLGIVELASGHPERAVGPLDQASELSPNDLNLLEYRGRAHSQVAQASYSRMATIDPDAWQVHKVRAELYASENKDREAITEYEQALKREQRNPDLFEALGDRYRHMNELEPARKAYQQELAISPQNPIAMYNLGSTEIDLGDPAGVPLLEAMLKVYGTSVNAEYYLGRGLALSNRDEEAATLLEQTAKADPDGEVGKRSYLELSRLYRRLHKPADAERALTAYNRLRATKSEDWQKLNHQPAASTK